MSQSAKRSRVGSVVRKHQAAGSRALARVRKYFPKVNHVIDATSDINVEVTQRDLSTAKRKNHEECAMAVACKRAKSLDGVIMSMASAYTIKGDTATRFSVPDSVSREIIVFDRGSDFVPGTYSLTVPEHSLGTQQRTGPKTVTGKKLYRPRHITTGVRAIIGSDKVR